MADPHPRSRRLGQVVALAGHVRWLLGERARWMIAVPLLALGTAAADLVLMVCLVRALLVLAETSEIGSGLPLLGSDRSIGFLLSIAGLAGVVSMSIRVVEAMLVGRLAARAASRARQQVIDAQLEASWRTVSRQRAGYVQSLLGLNTQHASNTPLLFSVVVSALVSLTVYGIFIVASSPVIAALFVVLGLGSSLGLTTIRGRMVRSARGAATSATDVQLLATSLHELSRELRVFGVTGPAREELARVNRLARRMLAMVRTRQRLLPGLFQQVVLLLVVIVVAVASGLDLETESFGAAAVLAVRSLSYLQQLNTAMQNYVEVRPYLEELRRAVDVVKAGADVRGAVPLPALRSVVLQDVSFGYDNVPVLKALDLEIRVGDRIGILGSSGAGKSTLLGILTGLLRPDSGAVLVNGRSLYEYASADWSRAIAFVGQDSHLLRGSVADNIAFYRPATAEEIREAAARASVLQDIEELEQGFDTLVGDGYADLSGGQRQRIAIARALLRHPSLIVLDEPTSALDAVNADQVAETLDQLVGDPAVVIVSHREELLRRCDRILTMVDGRLVPADPDAGSLVRTTTDAP